MTNKKRIFAAFITVMMLFSVFSVYAFAANPIIDNDYDLVPGYRCYYYVRYDGYNRQAHAQTLIVWYSINAATITAKTATQCVVAYTDDTYTVEYNASQQSVLSSKGDGVTSMLSVDFDAGKTVTYIATEHHIYINEPDMPETIDYYMYAGVDF